MKRMLTVLARLLWPRVEFDRPPVGRRAGRKRPTQRPALELLEGRSLLSLTFTVLNTADSGSGSLRDAITRANTSVNTGGPDAIHFNIPGAGTQTIQLLTPLPSITDPVVLDGYTQPGASRNTLASGTNAVLKIELNGGGITSGGPANGLVLEAADSTVTGLVINRFHDNGIVIINPGATGNKVQGDYLGTNVAGDAALPNAAAGVHIFYASNNSVGGTNPGDRNVISGNGGDGVSVVGDISLATRHPAQLNQVQNNYVGTNAQGTAALGNASAGVNLIGADSNTVGGTVAGARNVISGNLDGVQVVEQTNTVTATSGNHVEGNYIGTDAGGGTSAPAPGMGNSAYGVVLRLNDQMFLASGQEFVGGTAAGAGNVISGNGGHGVYLDGIRGSRVQGNYIGTDASGTRARPNLQDGVLIVASILAIGPGNSVGGTAAGARNVISANSGDGVAVAGGSLANVIQGNYLGTAADGTTPLGNGSAGVNLSDSNGNAVGGTAAGAGNVISANASHGVQVSGSATGNAIQGNAIFANGRLGINLVGGKEDSYGVTGVDVGVLLSGPNLLQSYPELTRAFLLFGSIGITGTLRSMPRQTYTLEFFASTAADPSGFGEGQTFLGSKTVTTDAVTGAVTFNAKFKPASGQSIITATATDAAGNTSEFSQAILAT